MYTKNNTDHENLETYCHRYKYFLSGNDLQKYIRA